MAFTVLLHPDDFGVTGLTEVIPAIKPIVFHCPPDVLMCDVLRWPLVLHTFTPHRRSRLHAGSFKKTAGIAHSATIATSIALPSHYVALHWDAP